MPYLRIYSPELAVDAKREIVKDLTEVVTHSLELPQKAANWCTIHFIHYRLEDLAIGGQLVIDNQHISYRIELFYHDIKTNNKEKIVNNLTEAFGRHLNLGQEKLYTINVIIKEYNPKNYAIGGKFITDYHNNYKEVGEE